MVIQPHTHLMEPCDCTGPILRDHHGLAVLCIPQRELVAQPHGDGLRVALVLVPAVVAIDADHVHKLDLKKKETVEFGFLNRG